ncbi:hypothetical protein [Burkholderia gladioli]|uniref:hypothetical protein n=1 Tax=Burkholderia gladioli TaxID=28095 RepID=UPI00264DA1E5|nr:hypothetical protein [Burkholderia gladioli]MDN7720002.1 hypothetical protein [Burkholderia gladioli]
MTLQPTHSYASVPRLQEILIEKLETSLEFVWVCNGCRRDDRVAGCGPVGADLPEKIGSKTRCEYSKKIVSACFVESGEQFGSVTPRQFASVFEYQAVAVVAMAFDMQQRYVATTTVVDKSFHN